MYRRALDLQPDDAATLFNYAGLLEDAQKNHSEALSMYRRAAELCPTHAPSLISYARQSLEYEDAAGEAQRALETALQVC